MGALAALAQGCEFSTFPDALMAVRVPSGEWVPVADRDLAALTDREWVELDDDDPATNMPGELRVTPKGDYALRRYLQTGDRVVVLKPLASPLT